MNLKAVTLFCISRQIELYALSQRKIFFIRKHFPSPNAVRPFQKVRTVNALLSFLLFLDPMTLRIIVRYWGVTIIGVLMLYVASLPGVRPFKFDILHVGYPVGVLMCGWAAVSCSPIVGYRSRFVSGLLQALLFAGLFWLEQTRITAQPSPVSTAVAMSFGTVFYAIVFMCTTGSISQSHQPVLHNHSAKHPECNTCGYDLTGNTSGVCPECGTPFKKKQPVSLRQR